MRPKNNRAAQNFEHWKLNNANRQEETALKKTQNADPMQTETDPADYVPTQSQIETFARRLMPEIKRFFADEQIQREFAEWQAKNISTEDNN